MPTGTRPKFRWAAKYLKEKMAADGSKIPNRMPKPVYFTIGADLTPPFDKDDYFKKNEKYFVTGGTYLWISRILYEKGPMTRREIYAAFIEEKTRQKLGVSDVAIRSILA